MPRARRIDTTLGVVGVFSTMLLVAAAHRNRSASNLADLEEKVFGTARA
jgi:hypothetical protein